MEKMKRVKSSLANQENKNRIIKKGRGSISQFERRNRMLKSRPPELDQLVKLPKDNLLPIKQKASRKYSIQRRR